MRRNAALMKVACSRSSSSTMPYSTMLRASTRARSKSLGRRGSSIGLLALMKARLAGTPGDEAAYQARVRGAVGDCVRRQVETGIDIVTDGEQSKSGFFTYVAERLAGFEARPDRKRTQFGAEVAAFPEYYEQYFKRAMLGGTIAPLVPLVCTGPVSYRGAAALRR